MDGTCRAKVTIGQATVELEGAEQFVRDELKAFREALILKAESPPPVHDAARQEPGEKPNIREFIVGMMPKTDMERAAVVAYYLKAFHAAEEVDGSLLNQWFVKAGWKPSPKPGNTLDNAMRQRGYFDKGSGAGKFKLSDAGVYYVENDARKAVDKNPQAQ